MQTMIINENRLNLADAAHRKYLAEQIEKHFLAVEPIRYRGTCPKSLNAWSASPARLWPAPRPIGVCPCGRRHQLKLAIFASTSSAVAWRTFSPLTMKITYSAMLLAWSPMRSMALAIDRISNDRVMVRGSSIM